jgi:hypothetical protein
MNTHPCCYNLRVDPSAQLLREADGLSIRPYRIVRNPSMWAPGTELTAMAVLSNLNYLTGRAYDITIECICLGNGTTNDRW